MARGGGQSYIHKDSQWQSKIEAERFWFENLPQELVIYTPRFLNDVKG